jgi:hypothetical protein
MQENWSAMTAAGVVGLCSLMLGRSFRNSLNRFRSGLPPAIYAQLPWLVVVKGALALMIVDTIGTNGSDRHRIVTRVFVWLIYVALPSLCTAVARVMRSLLSVLRHNLLETILLAFVSVPG